MMMLVIMNDDNDDDNDLVICYLFEILLKGCDLTVTDSKGQSAIEIARFYGHEAIIDYLQSKQK